MESVFRRSARHWFDAGSVLRVGSIMVNDGGTTCARHVQERAIAIEIAVALHLFMALAGNSNIITILDNHILSDKLIKMIFLHELYKQSIAKSMEM